MRKSARVWALALFACAIIFSGLKVSAQSAVTPEQEYKKRIHVTDDISPLGENPFGNANSASQMQWWVRGWQSAQAKNFPHGRPSTPSDLIFSHQGTH